MYTNRTVTWWGGMPLVVFFPDDPQGESTSPISTCLGTNREGWTPLHLFWPVWTGMGRVQCSLFVLDVNGHERGGFNHPRLFWTHIDANGEGWTPPCLFWDTYWHKRGGLNPFPFVLDRYWCKRGGCNSSPYVFDRQSACCVSDCETNKSNPKVNFE